MTVSVPGGGVVRETKPWGTRVSDAAITLPSRMISTFKVALGRCLPEKIERRQPLPLIFNRYGAFHILWLGHSPVATKA